jgi:hypothetical protein
MEGKNKETTIDTTPAKIDATPAKTPEGAVDTGRFSPEEYKEIVASLVPMQNEAKDLKQEIDTLGPDAFASKVMANTALKEKVFRFLENASAATYLIIAFGATIGLVAANATEAPSLDVVRDMTQHVEEFLKVGRGAGDFNMVRLFELTGAILAAGVAPLMAKDYFKGIADKAKEKIESLKKQLGIA